MNAISIDGSRQLYTLRLLSVKLGESEKPTGNSKNILVAGFRGKTPQPRQMKILIPRTVAAKKEKEIACAEWTGKASRVML